MEFLLREINLPEYSDEEVKPMIRELAIALQANLRSAYLSDSPSYNNLTIIIASYKDAEGDILNDLVDILREELELFSGSQ